MESGPWSSSAASWSRPGCSCSPISIAPGSFTPSASCSGSAAGWRCPWSWPWRWSSAAKKNALGTVIAILTAAESLGMVIGPIFGGLAMDALGATAAFSGCAVFMFFATITVLFQTGVKAPLVEESDLKTSTPARL
ncbi:MAG: MFS transporter [Deltaproteobacteria bacterium]|nr:MFS transporter [Deltaproteobacteria bacterium]